MNKLCLSRKKIVLCAPQSHLTFKDTHKKRKTYYYFEKLRTGILYFLRKNQDLPLPQSCKNSAHIAFSFLSL